jgi:hypothetical protein
MSRTNIVKENGHGGRMPGGCDSSSLYRMSTFRHDVGQTEGTERERERLALLQQAVITQLQVI